MPGLFVSRACGNSSVDRVANNAIRAAWRVHVDDLGLHRREEADTAIAGKRREALAERIEAAVLRAALVLRTEAGGERRGIGGGGAFVAPREGGGRGAP